MSKLYSIKMNDGSVHIMTLFSGTVEEAIAKWHDELKAKVVSHREISKDKIPSDRVFRDCWTDDNPTDTVDVCPKKARKQIRKARNKALDKLDKIALREQRRPNGKIKEVESEAQRLRDLPSSKEFKEDSVRSLKKALKNAEISKEIDND